MDPEKPSTSSSFKGHGVYIQECINAIHKVSLRNIGIEVTVPSRILGTPKTEVMPVIREFNFWSGRGKPTEEYMPDMNFTHHRKRDYDGQSLDLEELHKERDGKRINKVMVIASAGEGKTTLLKRYGKKAIESKLEHLSETKVVFFTNFRDLPGLKTITNVRSLLCEHFMLSLSVHQQAGMFEWMASNSDKLLFIFDGLDQAPWKLHGTFGCITTSEMATPDTIIYNLLSGKLFSGCKMLVSSREYVVCKLASELQPDLTVTLCGLSEENIKLLVKDLCEKRWEETWIRLTHELLALYSLCSTPMFLVFVCIVLLKYKGNDFNTLTSVVFEVLLTLQSSSHSREEQEYIKILQDLKRIALTGTEQGRVIFHPEDLKDCLIQLDDIKDLIISCPERAHTTGQSQFLLEGSTSLFFCHQSIQEALSALELIELDVPEFQAFLNNHTSESHWSVVFRFLVGALLNPVTLNSLTLKLLRDAEETRDLPQKSKLLHTWLINEYRRLKTSHKDSAKLEWISCVFECGSFANEIISSVEDLDFWKIDRPSHIFLVATLAFHLSPGKKIDIVEAVSNPAVASMLRRSASKLKIKSLEITSSECHEENAWSDLAYVVTMTKVSELLIRRWSPISSHVERFLEILRESGYTLNSLDAKGNIFITDSSLWSVFGKILSCCQSREFRMRGTTPSLDNIETFLGAVSGVQLHSLDISDVLGVPRGFWHNVGEIIGLTSAKEVRMQGCQFKKSQCLELGKGLRKSNSRIDILDISWNYEMDPECWTIFAEIISFCSVREVRMWKCQPKEGQLSALRDTLLRFSCKILTLEMYDNFAMTPTCWKILAEIVVGCDVRILRLEGCKPQKEHIEAFQSEQRICGSKVNISGCPELSTSWDDNSETSVYQYSSMGISRYIEPEGGTIILGGCSVIFPPGSLKERTLIALSQEHTRGLLEDSHVRITPILCCYPPGISFDVPVEVQLHTWCFTCIRDPVEVEATIFQKQQEAVDWTEMVNVKLGFAGPLIFKCQHFTKFAGWLRKVFSSAPIFRIKNLLSCNERGIAVSSFFHDDREIEKNIRSELNYSGYDLCLSTSNTLKVKSDYRIEVKISSKEGIKITPELHQFYGDTLCAEGDCKSLNFHARLQTDEENEDYVTYYVVKLNENEKINNPIDFSILLRAKQKNAEMRKQKSEQENRDCKVENRGNLHVEAGGVVHIQNANFACDNMQVGADGQATEEE